MIWISWIWIFWRMEKIVDLSIQISREICWKCSSSAVYPPTRTTTINFEFFAFHSDFDCRSVSVLVTIRILDFSHDRTLGFLPNFQTLAFLQLTILSLQHSYYAA